MKNAGELEKIKGKLDKVYEKFKNLKDKEDKDKKKWRLKKWRLKKWRLATYPYLGSEYGKKPKILFVSLDIGINAHNHTLSLNDQRKLIEDTPLQFYNPHLSGLCLLALEFRGLLNKHLKNETKELLRKKRSDGALKALLARKEKKDVNHMWKGLVGKKDTFCPGCRINPLSSVSFTNYHKFVRRGNTEMGGGKNQSYKIADTYQFDDWLSEEIEALNPEKVVFTFKPPNGKNGRFPKIWKKISTSWDLFRCSHPSREKVGKLLSSLMKWDRKKERWEKYEKTWMYQGSDL